MADPKKENESNLPLVGLGLILAAGAGVAVGWYMHKAPPAPTTQTTTGPAAAASMHSPAEPGHPGTSPATTSTTPPAPSAEGACADWTKAICDAAGEQSGDCTTVKRAAEMMSAAACTAALGDLSVATAAIERAKGACTELMTRLCKDIGEGTESCKMVKEQTPMFPPEQCQQMLTSYNDVLNQLRQMEESNKPLAPELVAKMSATDVGVFGPADAKVVLVEFSDFLCPACRAAAQTIESIRDRYKDTVRFVFRQFPLEMHGDNARLGAQAALAAGAQGKFWEMHDKLFAAQDRVRSDGRPAIDALAQELGLNMADFAAALDGKTFEAALTADLALGDEAKLRGTPSFFLDGKRMNANFQDPAAFSQALNDALTAAGVQVPPPPPPPAEAPAAPPATAPGPAATRKASP
ncbi:MAG: thioredoxin domain-containing protein, partial [Deltaproteobacteria bacterium]|nr:thioredoxin domain-containing protein [Deltaproteobacteria bacterium]